MRRQCKLSKLSLIGTSWRSWRPSKEASIHPDLPSAHFNPKSCDVIGRAWSRWQMLASDWSRPALLGWGQCGIPEVETSRSWLEFREGGRVWKMFSMHRRETLKNIRAMGMRLSFAIRNNKQTFFHLDLLSSDYAAIFAFLPLLFIVKYFQRDQWWW